MMVRANNRAGAIGVVVLLLATCYTSLSGEVEEVRRTRKHTRPFEALNEVLAKQGESWSLNGARLSKAFQADRDRLGKRFEMELMAYLAKDTPGEITAKHRRVAQYIADGQPRPHLCVCILEQGIALCRAGEGIESRAELRTTSILASLACEKVGLHALAVFHKREAQRLLAAEPSLNGTSPAMFAHDRKIYDSIEAKE